MNARIYYSLILFITVLSFGTIGFLIVEPTVHGAFESFYFTLVTMFTVGYGDIVPTTTASRVVAIIVVVGGITAAITALQMIFDIFATKDFRKELGLPERRTKMNNHIIICGYGNVGHQVYEQLKSKGDKFVFIEDDPAKVAILVDRGIPVISGEAEEEDVLIRANIAQAKTIILTLKDANNIIVTVMAKLLNPSIYVVSEVEDKRNEIVLKKAGADEVVHCHEMGARVMAAKARKTLVDPVCGTELDLKTVPLSISFEGENYYFDAEECKRAFEKNPKRFIDMKRAVDICIIPPK